jgi:hypothetical protein
VIGRARRVRLTLLLLAGAALVGFGGHALASGERFDHWRHRRLFPTCTGCHAGIESAAGARWPTAEDCAACHDGRIRPAVSWAPPASPPPSNLRFDHRRHARTAGHRVPADSLRCGSCHLPGNAPWMQVRRADPGRCVSCHGLGPDHLAVADTACRTCHLTLAEASGLPRATIAAFPASHQRADFGRRHEVSATCATCHARDFCTRCHVDAPEVPAIQALAADPRSLAIPARLEPPPDHADAEFTRRHGRAARKSPQRCATCHTSESCVTCHVAEPNVAVALHPSAPGRGAGAEVTRRRPPSHGSDFTDRHAATASASIRSCVACHDRADCLECHRPNPAAGGGYHPTGFLDRHPAAAYVRETDCAQCHDQGAFCADCHARSGLTARGTLRGGFHDAKPGFLLGHGPAARQSLASCVSCHAERDCLTCHSALGGRRFNPHGPGFDADRMRRHNSQVCTVCHGAAIPGASP